MTQDIIALNSEGKVKEIFFFLISWKNNQGFVLEEHMAFAATLLGVKARGYGGQRPCECEAVKLYDWTSALSKKKMYEASVKPWLGK